MRTACRSTRCATRFRTENVEIPGGTLEQGKWEVGLRTLGRIDASDQFNDIIIATVNGVPLRVSDIGYAEDTVQKVATSMFMQDGAPAVQLDIRRASGENTIKVTEAVKARLASVRQALPPDVTLTMNTDDSRFIYASISSLEEHLLWGSLLASLVVLFFIRNIRAVIISALAIPASIIATFTLMRAMDFTLNNMTLLALTLAVGIVIDDAIVVLENIFRYVEEKDRTPFDAAIEGTREVALPVMATTLSLIVIFLPVAFMTGYARRFIYPFGWTMAFAILVSMIVSFTLTPMLSSRWLKISKHGRRGRHQAPPVVSRPGSGVHRVAPMDARASDGDYRHLGRPGRADLSAEPDGRADVRARRGHGRIHDSRRHAARDLDRGDDRDRAKCRPRDRRAGGRVPRHLPGRGRPVYAFPCLLLSPARRGADRHPGAGDRARAKDPGAAPGI